MPHKRKFSAPFHPKNLLLPRAFLKLVTGTLGFCVLTLGILITIFSSPYQSSQDSRQQATGVGLTCDQICTSIDRCQTNLECVNLGSESRCRLSIYPSSSTCLNPIPGGLNKACNEYCADTNECGAGLICWFNQCRRPDNIDSINCTIPLVTVQQSIQSSCNQFCAANRDCPVNMRCYTNLCRLAINPTSQTCQSSDPVIPSSGILPKGGSFVPTPTQALLLTPTQVPTLIPSPIPTLEINITIPPLPETITVTPTEAVLPEVVPSPIDTTPPTQSSTIISQILNWWQELKTPEQANTRRMLTVIISIGFILMGLYLILTSRTKKEEVGEDSTPPPSTLVTSPPTNPKSTLVSPATKDSTTYSTTQTFANKTQTNDSTPPPSTLITSPSSPSYPTPPKHPNTNQPVPATVSSAQLYPSGGMTARLKQKGVTSPT